MTGYKVVRLKNGALLSLYGDSLPSYLKRFYGYYDYKYYTVPQAMVFDTLKNAEDCAKSESMVFGENALKIYKCSFENAQPISKVFIFDYLDNLSLSEADIRRILLSGNFTAFSTMTPNAGSMIADNVRLVEQVLPLKDTYYKVLHKTSEGALISAMFSFMPRQLVKVYQDDLGSLLVNQGMVFDNLKVARDFWKRERFITTDLGYEPRNFVIHRCTCGSVRPIKRILNFHDLRTMKDFSTIEELITQEQSVSGGMSTYPGSVLGYNIRVQEEIAQNEYYRC